MAWPSVGGCLKFANDRADDQSKVRLGISNSEIVFAFVSRFNVSEMTALWNFIDRLTLFFGIRRNRIVGPYNMLENAQGRLAAQIGASEGSFEMSWHDAIGSDHIAEMEVRDGSRAFALSQAKRMASFTVVLGGKPFHMELPLRKRPSGCASPHDLVERSPRSRRSPGR